MGKLHLLGGLWGMLFMGGFMGGGMPPLPPELMGLPPAEAPAPMGVMPQDMPPPAGMPVDPAMMGAPGMMPPPPSPFPTSMPDGMAMILAQALQAARDADHAQLDAMQDEASMGAMTHPIVQSMMAPPPQPMRGMAGGSLPPLPAPPMEL